MIKVGIIGGSGYVAGELIKILLTRPEVDIDFIFSHSRAGENVSDTHQNLFQYNHLFFTDKINTKVDIIFLCMGHGHSRQFLLKHSFSKTTKIIDMSSDFRLQKDAVFDGKKFVYGLPALNRKNIQAAQYIANPGCFATAIQLALLPLAHHQQLNNELHIHAITGSTGAGRKLSDSSHFSWRNNNVSIYKAFEHQHLSEIKEGLQTLQKKTIQEINFIPIRGNFTRGIFASLYMKTTLSQTALMNMYEDFYKNDPLIVVSDGPIHLKQVIHSNFNLLRVQKIDNKVLITSIIDNLQKGAAGQAVENMDLMLKFDRSLRD